MKPIPLPFQIIDGRKVMRRQDWARLRYRVQRYLSYLSEDELYQRLVDVFTNVTTLTPEGQIGLPALGKPVRFDWMELWGLMIEEYGLRGKGLPSDFIAEVPLVKPTAPDPPKGVRELTERKILAKDKLVKFGNRSWLEQTYKTGRWRFSPASYYDSQELCGARKDTEMELVVNYPMFERHPECHFDELDENLTDTLRFVQHSRIRAHTDYYIACFSRTMVYRLFDDFDSDSCLIVTDEEKFIAKMLNAFATFRPRWIGTCKPVQYIDPHLPPSHIDIYFAKHFRYDYQEEFRFVWKPSPYVVKLQPVFLDLGPLHDCCELLPVSQIRAA